jgi:tight adherence protein B
MSEFVIISAAAFIAVAAFAAFVWLWIGSLGPSSVEARLQQLSQSVSPEWELPSIVKADTAPVGYRDPWNCLRNSLNALLERSRSPLTLQWVAGLSVLGAAASLVAAVAVHAPLHLVPIATLGGGLLPATWLWLRMKARQRRFDRQFPEALDLLARALRSGRSLNSGMQVIVQEMLPPISEEFRIVTEAVNLGVVPEKALDDLAHRMPNPNLQFLTASVAMQRQSGGSLARILEKISGIVRERFRLLGQVQALTGEGRISGAVLMSLPIAVFFALYHLNPKYVTVLLNDEIGRTMLWGAILMQLVGAVVIRKVVDIKI